MQQFVFKPKRKRNGKTKAARCYSGKYKLFGDLRQTTVSLRTTDKQVAEQLLADIVRTEQRKRAGLEVSDVSGANIRIDKALGDFQSDLGRRGRNPKYIRDVGSFVRIISEFSGWKVLSDVVADGYLQWSASAANSKKAPKTLNEYLTAWNTFLNWLVEREAIERNPFGKIKKAETRGREVRNRRAFTLDELRRLIPVATPARALVYMVATLTGIRRNELESITWGDLKLETDCPCIFVGARNSKNKKTEAIPIHPDLLAKLKALKRGGKSEAVFKVPSRTHLLRKDLKAAGIPYKDERGYIADFHSFRHTFATMLQASGANQAVTMQAMRHSDPKLTAVTYTDANQLPVAQAIAKLPSIVDPTNDDTQIHSHKLGAEGDGVSQAVAIQTSEESVEPLETEGGSPSESPSVAPSQKGENGSCGWFRTNDLVINSHGKYPNN